MIATRVSLLRCIDVHNEKKTRQELKLLWIKLKHQRYIIELRASSTFTNSEIQLQPEQKQPEMNRCKARFEVCRRI